MDPFPELDPAPRRRSPLCGSRPTRNSPTCAAPAVWHVAWHFTPRAEFTLLCDQHMAQVQRTHVYMDRHPVTAACTTPGTGWATRANPSYCTTP